VPSVLVPFVADQPSWARRVDQLGVGPHPIPFSELTAPRLADAIQQAASDEGIRRRAAVIGQRIRSEDGAAEATEVFLNYVRKRG
jgi:UDP:flavonoid glycosyltransferase YjiC (YdhE family)